MSIEIEHSHPQFEQAKNFAGEIREAIPRSPKPEIFGDKDDLNALGGKAHDSANEYKEKRRVKDTDFIKIGLRMFSRVFILTAVPYYGYYLWKGVFYFPQSGEEKIAGMFILIALAFMLVGAQRRNKI